MPKNTSEIKTGITLTLTYKTLKITFKITCPQKCNHKLTHGSMIILVVITEMMKNMDATTTIGMT